MAPDPAALSLDELMHAVGMLVELGVRRVRLTGGEPLLRPDVVEVVRKLAALGSLDEITLTTNGQRLAALAAPLREAGLSRVNVHIDSLVPDRYTEICQGRVGPALDGLRAAIAAGLSPKLNVVVQRDVNGGEIRAFCDVARQLRIVVRFIEVIDTGVARSPAARRSVSGPEIAAGLVALGAYPRRRTRAPAQQFLFPDGTQVGLIASGTMPFCDRCNRLRLSSDGMLRTCLYAPDGLDLGALSRAGAPRELLLRRAQAHIAEKRSLHPGTPAIGAAPHFSMATLGG